MGILMSLPLLGGLSSIATSLVSGIVFFMGGTAASALFKSCNCNSSIATRVGFAILFCVNSMLAWLMRTDIAIRQIEKLSWDWVKMDCTGGKCYGLLAVHRFCFALGLLHLILALSLIGVTNTRTKRASIQNGWWGPKVLLWMILVFLSFLIPNEFFMFYGSYLSPIGASLFILLGLVLLVDFAHSWSESCLDRWESSPNGSNLWQFILVGSTFGMYILHLTLTILLYVFFAGSQCSLNTFFISANLFLSLIVTISSVLPAVQEANPRSGLAQASMVSVYCTYLVSSAVANHDEKGATCNPITNGSSGARTGTVVMGAMFTFLAVAYSTTRAATQTQALSGKGTRSRPGGIRLAEGEDSAGDHGLVTSQPTGGRKDTMRYQALLAAVEAGSLPASALEEDDDEGEANSDDGNPTGEDRDDEKTGTKYSYTWFHIIFIMASMYVAGLLTDWRVVSTSPTASNADPSSDDPTDVYIGRSEGAMWMRIVSSWLAVALYLWSLYAPVILPDRFGEV
ncbi:serine incorporator/TMS membrane protein [Mrakia frigida]|uniref:Tms1p n=1 Tax=Mrakia frigida TaxID=29902 RepID=UPI003FCBF9BA